MSLGRSSLVRKLMSVGLTRDQAECAVGVVLSGIADGITEGGKVSIRGFGTFLHKSSRRSIMFDPRAGGQRVVAGRTLVRFKPSGRFEKALRGPSG